MTFVPPPASNGRKNIVIVGGSYAGLWAINQLTEKTHKTHRVILIEQHTHYNYLFAFPRFATVPGYEHKAFIPFRGLVNQEKFPGDPVVVCAKVVDVRSDRVIVEKTIAEGEEGEGKEGEREEIEFEYLVLCSGTKLVPPANVPTMGKPAGIQWFRDHQAKVKNAEKVVLVGAGAVGVQMAADIKDYYPNKSVTLIHSRTHLMNRFHPKLHEMVAERFKELGVEVILNDRVKIPEGGFPSGGPTFDVELSSGRKVPTDFVIPTIGMTPNSAYMKHLTPSSILTSPWGFISIKPTLQISDPKYPHIFVMGDIANTTHQKAARPAYYHATTVANNIGKLIDARAGKGEKEGEVKLTELEEYPAVPTGILLSQGITRRLDFWDPEKEGDEPKYEWKLNSQENYGIDDVWARWAPGLTDYWE